MTVGAVVVDHEGNVAAAVSSGGLALKHPGRVGQAALYGCGCWAENTGAHNPYSTAVSTSGCGEHLVRTILARECSHALQAEDAHQALLETMQNKFISSPFLASEDGVLGGVIVLRSCRCSAEPDSSQNKQTLLVEFLWSHTTESMCVGYMSAQDGKAKTHISRLPPGAVAGQSVAIEGGVCRLEGSGSGGFVLVHAGAGYHSESKAKEYKHVCKRACQKAIEKLQAGALATDAVTAALVELEDSPFTNAGMGSNLNLLGEIECDASIMDGKSLNFGAVGALSGIKNPVSVANRLLCEGQKGKLSAGRIPPCFLVGEGAYRWAVDHGIPSCPLEHHHHHH
uniref:Threonine aspartase 1,Threonine aspartase 1 n=1 Tax=Homo sapiens TaxID=9606 RepID=UPI0019D71EC7|nr:Chain A, Threonine aspartase 1,Threonine aspartase 1 [Homo sapiens]6UGK_B Chain B, Threonine aspartase 1,Threonine aspartase 1 [Homo sapiens]